MENPLDILAHGPGVSLTRFESTDKARVACLLHVAPDAPVGLVPIRLRTAHGLSNIKLFSIGNLPEIAEKEPNGDRSSPQLVTSPVTINGTVMPEDLDLFAFDAAAGQTLAFEVEAMRLGDVLFDPVLTVFDATGKPLASADDSPLLRQDAALVVTFPAPGRYTLEVRETAYGGSPDCHYRVHMGAVPRPFAVYPCGGKLGARVDLTWIGDPTISAQSLTLPALAPPEFAILPERAAPQPASSPATQPASASAHPSSTRFAPSPVPFRLNDLTSIVEAEPNDDDDHATSLSVPGGASGIADHPGDVDCFSFDAKKGQSFEAQVFARRLRSPLDSVLNLRRWKGAGIAGSDDAVGPDSSFRFTNPDDGKYVLEVRDLLRKGGPGFTYYLEVAPVRPELNLSMLPEAGSVSVPLGNRAAILLTAARRDFGGPLTIAAAGLPPGVIMLADTMHATTNQLPVVFETSPAATAPATQPASQLAPHTALAGALVDIVARHADPQQSITGRLRHPIDLVKYENNPFYQWPVDRLALAVIEPVPVSIAVAEPRVPIVRRGSMELPVSISRSGEFKPDVTLRMLWNPPGIASGQVTAHADQTTVSIPLNASEGAAVGRWKIVVVAATDFHGAVEVAAAPVTLEVAEPFVDFAVARSRTETGKPVDVSVKVTHRAPFEGSATAQLVGLPPRVAASQASVTKETQELKFPLAVDPAAPPGQHGSVFVRTVVMMNGQPIVHQSPPGLLIIDKPLPPPDPRVEAARAEARRKAAEEKARKKAEKLAAAEERKRQREAQRAPPPASQKVK